MSKPCQDACDAENARAMQVASDGATSTVNKPCQGWNFIRAEDALGLGGNKFARCCLKTQLRLVQKAHAAMLILRTKKRMVRLH